MFTFKCASHKIPAKYHVTHFKTIRILKNLRKILSVYICRPLITTFFDTTQTNDCKPESHENRICKKIQLLAIIIKFTLFISDE